MIRLTGAGRIEDAETLVALLHSHPGCTVDLTDAGPLHTAVTQVLLAFRQAVAGQPADAFLAEWVLPLAGTRARRPAAGRFAALDTTRYRNASEPA